MNKRKRQSIGEVVSFMRENNIRIEIHEVLRRVLEVYPQSGITLRDVNIWFLDEQEEESQQ